MIDSNDPLTGEKVQASINEWESVLDIASQGTEDLLRWINGEITDEQIANGQYMQQWVQASQLGSAQYTPAVLSTKEIQSRLDSIDKSNAQPERAPGGRRRCPRPCSPRRPRRTSPRRWARRSTRSSRPRRSRTLGSQWEAQLVTPNMLQMAGPRSRRSRSRATPTTLNMASRLRGLDPRLQKWSRGVVSNAQITRTCAS